MILDQDFYNRSTIKVARELLGQYLVRKTSEGVMVGKIIETEAYCGPKDKASHASKGITPRTEVMFGPPGMSYIYLIYGMYNCLNIITEKEGYPAAVLIRGIEPVRGVEMMMKNRSINSPLPVPSDDGNRRARGGKNLTNGPGKLCQALCLTKEQNNFDVTNKKHNLWIESSDEKILKIKKGSRVGIDYAQEYKDKPWRFWV